MEADALEPHLPGTQDQVRRPRGVLDLGACSSSLKARSISRQGVLDLAIDDAKEAQGDEDLQQEGVDQHQVADAHGPVGHPAGGKDHHQGHPQGDDGPLTEVQQRHGGLALDGHLLPVRKGRVVAGQLQPLVAEVLDRLKVDQAVEGLAVGLGVEPVHGVAVVHAPLGDGKGEDEIDRDGAEGHQGEDRGVLGHQDGRHQTKLHHHRQDAEDHIVEDGAHRAGAALDVATHPSALALQVVAQGQPMQMGQTRVARRRMAR